MRQYLRHPSELPVELCATHSAALDQAALGLSDISLGGVACHSRCPFFQGDWVELKVPVLGDEARYQGVIAWCQKKHKNDYLLGIEFTDSDNLFRARMIEQICQIERYRKRHAAATGELLTSEQAAQRWINRHAASFNLDREN